MPSLGPQKPIEQIERHGHWGFGLVGLVDGLDQRPVVSQPLISEHPVHHRTYHFPIGRPGSLLQDSDSSRLDGGCGFHGRRRAATEALPKMRRDGAANVRQGLRRLSGWVERVKKGGNRERRFISVVVLNECTWLIHFLTRGCTVISVLPRRRVGLGLIGLSCLTESPLWYWSISEKRAQFYSVFLGDFGGMSHFFLGWVAKISQN